MSETNEPFYSVNDTKNNELYAKYKAECPSNVTFVGRLGMYKYNDMDDTIISALNMDLTKFAKKI
jgi:UDP-galactopyranose mutase